MDTRPSQVPSDERKRQPERLKLGAALREIGQQIGGVDLDINRDKSAPRLLSFEQS